MFLKLNYCTYWKVHWCPWAIIQTAQVNFYMSQQSFMKIYCFCVLPSQVHFKCRLWFNLFKLKVDFYNRDLWEMHWRTDWKSVWEGKNGKIILHLYFSEVTVLVMGKHFTDWTYAFMISIKIVPYWNFSQTQRSLCLLLPFKVFTYLFFICFL